MHTENSSTSADDALARAAALEAHIVELEARAAIVGSGGDFAGLAPHVVPRLKALPDSSGRIAVVVARADDPSQAEIGPNGRPMEAAELVAKLSVDRDLAPLFNRPDPWRRPQKEAAPKADPRVVKLSAEEAKDPKIYAHLKSRRLAGEIDSAVDHLGRRIV